MSPIGDENYARAREAAEEDGTALPERTDDLPPSDLYHGAVALAKLLEGDLPDALEFIGLPDTDPSRWEALDVARAADYARKHRPDAFASLTERFPWMAEIADQSFGAHADGF